MTCLRKLIACLLLFAFVPIARADAKFENGGVIILLRAVYTYYSGSWDCSTLVVVASRQELRALADRLATDKGVDYVHLDASDLNMRLRPVNAQVISGHLVGKGQRVLVVSEDYALKHGF